MAANDIVLYVRVSTDNQDYQRQIDDLKQWCNNRYNILQIFEDKMSGFKSDDERLGLYNLKKYCVENNVKMIAVWELSRLSRDKIFLLQLCQWFQQNQINVYFYQQSFYLLDNEGKISPTTDLSITILGHIAQSEALSIKDRMASGRKNAKLRGQFTGGKIPVGYKIEDKKIVRDEETATQLIATFNKYAQGDISIFDLAKENKYKNYHKTLCTYASLAKVLHNEIYTGQKENQKAEQLISIDLFNKVQELTVNKNKSFKRTSHIYCLRGILKCPICGKSYAGNNGKNMYMCLNHKSGCSSASISYTHLDSIIFRYVAAYAAHAPEMFMPNKNKDEEEIKQLELKLQICNDEIIRIERSKKKLNIKLNADTISVIEFSEEAKKLKKEKENVESDISSTKELIAAIKNNDYSKTPIELLKEIEKIRDLNTIREYIQKCVSQINVINADEIYKKIIYIKLKGFDTQHTIIWNSKQKKKPFYFIAFPTKIEREHIINIWESMWKMKETHWTVPLNDSINYAVSNGLINEPIKYELIQKSNRNIYNKPYSVLLEEERKKKVEYMRKYREKKRDEINANRRENRKKKKQEGGE